MIVRCIKWWRRCYHHVVRVGLNIVYEVLIPFAHCFFYVFHQLQLIFDNSEVRVKNRRNHGDEDDDVNYARVVCDLVYTNA